MARKAGMAAGVEVARISVKVSPDTKEFRSELQRELTAIEKSMKGDIEVNAHLDPAQAMADFQRMMAKLKAQGAKGVKVNTSVSQSAGSGGGSGGRGGRGGGSSSDPEDLTRLQKLFQNLRSKLLQAPNFGTGINPSGYLVILTLISAVLAPLIGLVTGFLLTLPGLLSLVLTPIAALTLGLDGLKQAAEVLKEPFEALKTTMSAAVKDQFTPIFEQLRNVFPALQEALPAVSQGLSQMFGAIVNTATSPAGLESIKTTIFQIGAALQGAAPGMGSFTGALMRLAEAFTGGPLQGLVTWFNGATASFDAWVTKAKESGELDTIFQRLGQALKYVADLLGQLVAIGIETITDPGKWNSFMAALKIVGGLLYGLVWASSAFLGAIDATAAALNFVKNLIAAVFNTVINFFTSIPGAVSSAWSTVTGVISGVFSAIVSTVQSAIQTVIGVLQNLPTVVGGVWGMIVTAAQGAWNGVVSVVQNAWNGIVSAIQTGVATAMEAVTNFVSSVISALASLGSEGLAAGTALVQGLINGIGNLIGSAIAKARELASSVAGAVKGFLGIESPSKVFTEFGENSAQGFANGIAEGTKSAVEAAKDLANQVKKAMDAGGDGSSILGDVKPEDLKTLIAAIEEEKKRLKIIKNDQLSKEGKASVQQQLDALQAQKDILSYQRDRIKNQGELNSTTEEDPFVKAASGLMKSPLDFAQATGKQFMSDIGISGDGFISKAITEGISYVFNIGSVDEALSIKDRQESKSALAIAGR